jgi:glutathione synthase/RimK-type ligase-like ATP-grasp enzyme
MHSDGFSLGIVGRDDDPSVRHIAAMAGALGFDVAVIDLRGLRAGRPAAFDLQTFTLDGAPIDGHDAYVIRSYPAATALTEPHDTTRTAGAFWQLQTLQKERTSFALSFLWELEVRGALLVNPLLRCEPFDHKARQLSAFAAAGLPVPATVVTNDPDEARRAAARFSAAVIKPLGGGAHTRRFEDVEGALDAIRTTPAIVQALAPGDNVRATVVWDRVVSAVIIESETLDYREDPAYAAGGGRYRETTLTADEERAARAAARLCGHHLSEVDLRRGPQSSLLLEANAAPVYLEIERRFGHPITERLLRGIAARLRRRRRPRVVP